MGDDVRAAVLLPSELEEEVVARIEEIAYSERNRYVHGFVLEALRRLALRPKAGASVAKALATFVAPKGPGTMRWVPPEMQMAMGLHQEHFDKTSLLYVPGPRE